MEEVEAAEELAELAPADEEQRGPVEVGAEPERVEPWACAAFRAAVMICSSSELTWTGQR